VTKVPSNFGIFCQIFGISWSLYDTPAILNVSHIGTDSWGCVQVIINTVTCDFYRIPQVVFEYYQCALNVQVIRQAFCFAVPRYNSSSRSRLLYSVYDKWLTAVIIETVESNCIFSKQRVVFTLCVGEMSIEGFKQLLTVGNCISKSFSRKFGVNVIITKWPVSRPDFTGHFHS
jgi:hypothetical protein